MAPVATTTVAAAFLFDVLVGELPERIHPVALFGRLVEPFDRTWSRPRSVGVLAAVGFPLLAAALMGGLTALAVWLHPIIGVAFGGLALTSTISLRMLRSVGSEVIDLTQSDTESARGAVRSLVGRDPTTLSVGEIRSAAVESVAENLADGFVAPLLAFVLGAQLGVSVGVGAAVWVKSVNTLDSMLGYRSKPVGWGSARLDDAVMWFPARLTAVLIAVAARDVGALARARPWVGAPPSPNSGWPMATMATALNVELRKPGVYDLNPTAPLPSVDQARQSVRLVGIAGLLAFVIGGVMVWS